MNREDIIRMAREAEMGFDTTASQFVAELEHFAALVAAAERDALQARMKLLEDEVATIHAIYQYHHTTKSGLILYTRHYTQRELYDAEQRAKKTVEALSHNIERDAALARDARVPEHTLPTLRDKHGHMVQYPGRIVYVHDNWRLVYIGTIDGGHEFFAEEVSRTNLGPLSFDAAKTALLDLIRYNKENPL